MYEVENCYGFITLYISISLCTFIVSTTLRCELYYQNDLCMIFNTSVIPFRHDFNGLYWKGVSMFKYNLYTYMYGVQAFNTYTKNIMYPILRVGIRIIFEFCLYVVIFAYAWQSKYILYNVDIILYVCKFNTILSRDSVNI